MPKPENRAKRRQKKVTVLIPPSERHEEMPHSTPPRFRERLKTIAEVVAAIVTILSIVWGIYDVLRPPQIHVQPAQTSAPFSLYFSFHNPSWVFRMKDVRVTCTLKDVADDRGNHLTNDDIEILPKDQKNSIGPGETVHYNCPLDGVLARSFGMQLGTILTAQILLEAKFKTMSIERNTYSDIFNWNQASHQWMEGEIMN